MDVDVQTESDFLSTATSFDFVSGSYKKSEIVKLQLNSTASSHQLKIFSLCGIRISVIFSFRKCFICRNELYRNSVVVSSNDRFSLFFERNVWIPDGARCCSIHVVDHQIKIEDFNQIKPFSIRIQELSSEDVQFFLSKCQELFKNHKRRFNFDNHRDVTDDEYRLLTSLSREDFDDLVNTISSSNIRNSSNRSIRTCIGIYLCKLRLGVSNRLLAHMFDLPDKRAVSRIIESARQAASISFVHKHLGFSHVTRTDVINHHTTTLARQLITDGSINTAIVCIDGTYIYIQVKLLSRKHVCNFLLFRNHVTTNSKEKLSICTKKDRY